MIVVVEPGPLASVQDPLGRPGWRRYGVPVGGAADVWSARLANRLAGNPDDAALIEITLGGAAFRLDAPGVVAVTGGLDATIGGRPAPRGTGIRTAAGSLLRLEPSDGVRGYLAINGGVIVQPVMGSASTDLRSGFGGHEGRALRPGDRLDVGPPYGSPGQWMGTRDAGPIRVVAGPHPSRLEALVGGTWTVGLEADRAGVRLDGVRLSGSDEIASMGLPLGAIQLPPDGRPIVMLADRPVTGGYPVPACVIRSDVGRVAQLRPGDPVRFTQVSPEEAREAWASAEEQLGAVEPMGTAPDDGHLGWIGSHD